MLVSSWDNRRDKGTWEEEEERPGGAAETKVAESRGRLCKMASALPFLQSGCSSRQTWF